LLIHVAVAVARFSDRQPVDEVF